MKRLKYVSYLRVSTARQERSRLGLEAQKAIIEHYAKIEEAEIVMEFVETESGKDIENRPKLMAAVRLCNENNYTLIVAKLDRLSRDVEHIFKLKKLLGEKFKSCDLPDTDTVTIGIYAVFAQKEREIISIRTKQALRAKEARGEKIDRSKCNIQKYRHLGQQAVLKYMKEYYTNEILISVTERCVRQRLTLNESAELLNKNNLKTRRGKPFSAISVLRLKRKIKFYYLQ